VDETNYIKVWKTGKQGEQLTVLLKCFNFIVLLFFFLLNTSLNLKILFQTSKSIATDFKITTFSQINWTKPKHCE